MMQKILAMMQKIQEGGSEFSAVPSAAARAHQHRRQSPRGLVSRSIGSICSLVSLHLPYLGLWTGESFGKPHEKSVLIWFHLGGQNQKITNFLRIQPIHVKCLLSDMCKLLEDNFHRLGILRGKVKGVSYNIFLVRNLPPDFIVLSVDLESAPGADRRAAARQIGQQRAIWVYMQLGFPPSALFASGRSRTNCAI